jgi:arylsulfatase A-like enzyme
MPLHKIPAARLIALLMISAFLAIATLVAVPDVLAARRPSKPNVVLIFCDDLGYGDIGPFGCRHHRTPNLDRMAKQGRRFTSFYVTSGVCTPSRSSLMTGCYPKRVGLDQNETGAWVLFPGNKEGLHPSEITIAEIFKSKGYATAMVGKWHLGDQPEFLPTRQGFDQYFGIPYSNDMGPFLPGREHYPPMPLLRDEKVVETNCDQSQLTPRYTAEALEFLDANKDRPFFLYFAHTFPHNPVHASERFKGKSANNLYGDCVEEIDWSVGELLDRLERHSLAEKTLVIFTSDNGAASRWGGNNGPLRGFKGSTWEGGMREPCVMWWPGQIPADTSCDQLMSTLDLLPTFAHLIGAQVPQDRIIDGVDATALLFEQPCPPSPRESFFYYFRDRLQAVRNERYKLILPRKQGKKTMPMQLYDLRDDPGESRNLLETYLAETPEIVAAQKSLMRLAESCRKDLGDGKEIPGENCRKPGFIEDAKPLVPREKK